MRGCDWFRPARNAGLPSYRHKLAVVEFSELIRRRCMVRAFHPDRPVTAQMRDRLLAAARRAPSAGFSQGWGFLVLEDDADRDLFWSVTTAADPAPDAWLTGMRDAPLLVVCFSNKSAYLDRYAEPDKGWTDRSEDHWPVPYWDIDTGFAALLIHLDAIDQGLGSCFFGVPPQHVAALAGAFGVPDEFRPVGVLAIGYPAPDRRSPSLRRGHRPEAEVVHLGRWHG